MKLKKGVVLAVLIFFIVMISHFGKPVVDNQNTYQQSKTSKKIKEEEKIKVMLKDNQVISMDLEDYVIGVVAGEMPASFELSALESQAIASRTYAIYKRNQNKEYDVLTTTADQVYLTKEEMQEKWKNDFDLYFNKIKKAVSNTKGLIIKYNNEAIKAYYFAMSNGKTEDSINVFNEQQDYLISVESVGEEKITNKYIQTVEFSIEDFLTKLSLSGNTVDIKNIVTLNSGRIKAITINDQVFTGVSLRKLLGLRSTDFDINIEDNNVLITTKGYGHGVGMSQYGANVLAKEGHNYEYILKHYYHNVEISSI